MDKEGWFLGTLNDELAPSSHLTAATQLPAPAAGGGGGGVGQSAEMEERLQSGGVSSCSIGSGGTIVGGRERFLST